MRIPRPLPRLHRCRPPCQPIIIVIIKNQVSICTPVVIDQDKEHISEKDRPKKEHWRQRWEQPLYFLQFSKIFTPQQHSTQLIKSMLLNILQLSVIFSLQQKILNCAWSRFIPVMLSSSIRYPDVLKQAYLAKLKKIVCWQQCFQSKIVIKTYHHINSILNGPTRLVLLLIPGDPLHFSRPPLP